MYNPRIAASLESIDFQTGADLFHDLNVLFSDLGKVDFTRPKILTEYSKKMESVIFKRTGISLSLNLDSSLSPNAYVIVPILDRNHPLLNGIRRIVLDSKVGFSEVEKKGGKFVGQVDRKRSRVYGDFSKVKIKAFVTKGLMKSFSSDEVAAIMLHELGHVFTYFEYIGRNVVTNYILEHASSELTQTRDVKKRIEIITDASKALGIDVENKGDLATSRSVSTVVTILLKNTLESQYSDLESQTYDETAWEMLCDQFATRHGAGRSLALALDKMNRRNLDPAYRNTGTYLLIEALKFTLFVITIPIFYGIVQMLILFSIDPDIDLYDKPKSRIQRIKTNMVSALKDRNLSDDVKQQYIEDIEVIDAILNEMEERRTLIQLFWNSIRPSSRRQFNQKRFQQSLERLVNNDLYLKSAQLKTLKL